MKPESLSALAQLRRLRDRRAVDRLAYLRLLRAVAATTSQVTIARALGLAQPSVSEALQAAQRVPDVRPGFSGADPYEVAQRYSVGDLSREQLVDELARWPYALAASTEGPHRTSERNAEWEHVVRALARGLIDDAAYEEIRLRSTERPTRGQATDAAGCPPPCHLEVLGSRTAGEP